MAWDDDLTSPHLEIAGSDHRRIGVLAGPGTGKTRFGLMRRVARLLEAGVQGKRILLISFTRVAAADLRDKVAELDAPGIEDVRATTLHGYCFGLLQRASVLKITGRTPRIMLDHEVDLMLRDIGDHFGDIFERRRTLEAYVAGWARGLEDHPGLAIEREDREFQRGVLSWLREHKAMLIGEVVPEAYRYLTANPACDELDSFDHVIADEYQDLNVIEQKLLDKLAANGSLCIAGDDDQSIYRVRYANPEGIVKFLKRPDVEPHSIETCGRCPGNIIAMANSLIQQAPGRDKKDLVPLKGNEPGRVTIVQWNDADAEIDGVVSAIAHSIATRQANLGDILVLTNWRKAGERIKDRLNEIEIPTHSYFTEEEMRSDECREALAILRLLVNSDDAVALRVVVGLGDASGRSAAYRRLLAFCHKNSVTPLNILTRAVAGERLAVNVPALVSRWRHAVERVEQLRELELHEVVDTLFPEGQESVAALRMIGLEALAEAKDVKGLLESVVQAITQEDVPQHPDFVRVMSLHKSKGLTSRIVYVVNTLHGVLPTIRNEDATEIEAATCEGRRLFYVAVTRAAAQLVISSSLSMDLADAIARGVIFDPKTIRNVAGRHVVRTIASPYITELGPVAPKAVRGTDWLAQDIGIGVMKAVK
jgi:DNA helicase-2/ATP-dependent DNA helicase PcrA